MVDDGLLAPAAAHQRPAAATAAARLPASQMVSYRTLVTMRSRGIGATRGENSTDQLEQDGSAHRQARGRRLSAPQGPRGHGCAASARTGRVERAPGLPHAQRRRRLLPRQHRQGHPRRPGAATGAARRRAHGCAERGPTSRPSHRPNSPQLTPGLRATQTCSRPACYSTFP